MHSRKWCRICVVPLLRQGVNQLLLSCVVSEGERKLDKAASSKLNNSTWCVPDSIAHGKMHRYTYCISKLNTATQVTVMSFPFLSISLHTFNHIKS